MTTLKAAVKLDASGSPKAYLTLDGSGEFRAVNVSFPRPKVLHYRFDKFFWVGDKSIRNDVIQGLQSRYQLGKNVLTTLSYMLGGPEKLKDVPLQISVSSGSTTMVASWVDSSGRPLTIHRVVSLGSVIGDARSVFSPSDVGVSVPPDLIKTRTSLHLTYTITGIVDMVRNQYAIPVRVALSVRLTFLIKGLLQEDVVRFRSLPADRFKERAKRSVRVEYYPSVIFTEVSGLKNRVNRNFFDDVRRDLFKQPEFRICDALRRYISEVRPRHDIDLMHVAFHNVPILAVRGSDGLKQFKDQWADVIAGLVE